MTDRAREVDVPLQRNRDPVEVRVLGCLLEKEQATPDHYPLTLHALVSACNQRSSREPVMDLGEADVRGALDRLHGEVLVWPVTSARSERWRHTLDRQLDLDPPAKAVLTLLMLRGPQTPGELRSRADRLHAFASVEAVETALESLAQEPEPRVVRLPRGPGQKEARWAHLLAGEVATTADRTAPDEVSSAGRRDRVAELEARIDELEARVADLEARIGS
jgi:uncharacterized protein YceH (UPF0502 family)